MNYKAKRIFLLGEEWFFFKIYLGPETSEVFLTEEFYNIVNHLLKNNIITEWFFIRYADPDYHLRIRLRLKKQEDIGVLIQKILPSIKLYVDHGLIWNYQIDTYKRELERYGSNTIDFSEDIFYFDSMFILSFLKYYKENDSNENLRWLSGLSAIDSLLDSFKCDLDTKIFISNFLKESYYKEFGVSKIFRQELSKKYRANKKEIEFFLTKSYCNDKNYDFLSNLINTKEENIKGPCLDIIDSEAQGTLDVSINSLICSHIHMLCNRLFLVKNRANELVIYDFLFRYYQSLKARRK
ncbi:thiopeptide-type bacteriocin biosynthesis protein [uncultured Dokdonia sp.]|uniref:thiopeptide-type bacteriocin biosynthesis protein n=1 Tax=uncultured Dokdonia sp. TaxID=575653 RepID=UPI0026044E23|nr:thiopeptide-type bacteriocin biosynthesis protein [uncultured Dokdonia sp.]